MSTAQVAGAAPAYRGDTSAAAARVRLSASRYRGLSRKVRSSGPASSRAATSRIRRSESVFAPSVAPHQPATSPNEGAELGGKKRILANTEFRQKRRRARQPLARPLVGEGSWSILERRAAREVEELGLVVFAF